MDYFDEIKDSFEPEENFKLFGFYIYGGKYFTSERPRSKEENIKFKNYVKKELSNFVGASLFHLVDGTNNTRRIIKVQRNTGEIEIVEIQSSEMKLESFETILKSKRCTFLGNSYQLKKIFAQWMDEEEQAYIVEILGWNNQHNIYAFANAVFTEKSKLVKVDELGIVNDPVSTKKYYLPAQGLANISNQDYEGERKFRFIDSEMNFERWSKLYYKAFETNGAIAILFLILSLFWDIVFQQVGFFPFLFLFGAYGTGKTSMVEFLIRVFGDDYKGIPLNNATQVALSRAIASRNNSIFYLKEYTKETDEANQDLFLTAYDGSGRATGIKSNDNRTKVAMVKSAIIVDGNELPTQKTAVLSRMILLNFEKNTFTSEQKNAYGKLSSRMNSGFGKVIIDILQQRNYFEDNFRNNFNENLEELRELVPEDFAERTTKHVALLLTPAKMLIKKLPFPFSFTDITKAIIDNTVEQNQLLKQTDEVTAFWTAFSWGISTNQLVEYKSELGNKKQAAYNLKECDIDNYILQIRFKNAFPIYVKYCRNNGQRYLDENSLRKLITSKAYKAFITGNQKNRGVTTTDFHFGSCYQYKLEKEADTFSINEVELTL